MSEEVRQARRSCIGGSDARIIMSGDQPAIERLWGEKRGDLAPEDLSDVLIVQMGNITEDLNLDWFELNHPDLIVTDEQTRPAYEAWPVAMSTLDGIVRKNACMTAQGVLEAKWMMPFNWSLEKAVEKYYAQCQHNMMVTGHKLCWLSIITGGGQYVVQKIEADEFWQAGLLDAERAFWDCVQTGKLPGNPVLDTPDLGPPVKKVDMTGNNQWADFAATLIETVEAAKKHDTAKEGIKKLVAKDVAEATGHDLRLYRNTKGSLLIEFPKAQKAAVKQARKAA
ncbi:MAG: YqaJ viral recombinase family protein [Rhizobiaceae bacterium]|nr:YqaJ viral recombinase family protein [Rhizobiaceae bacterium]MCC0000871.1 YqaJ viral recombinase family protein [Methylobacteriaceae bacterium]